MKIITLSALILLVLSFSASADYVKTESLNISSENIKELEIDCGAGFLEIQGVDGIDQIEVKAEIVIEGVSKSKAQKIIDREMELTLESEDNTVYLASHFKSNSGFFSSFRGDFSRNINLMIKMPKDIALNIDDGSGYIEIADIEQNIKLDDGSGNIGIENIIGKLRIDDGSGELSIKDVKGNINLDDGSGEIEIRNVVGDIRIDDGSGEIYVRKIDGSVIISDGSGDIRVRDITNDVDVIDDSSGDFDYARVDGQVIY